MKTLLLAASLTLIGSTVVQAQEVIEVEESVFHATPTVQYTKLSKKLQTKAEAQCFKLSGSMSATMIGHPVLKTFPTRHGYEGTLFYTTAIRAEYECLSEGK
jgi:hypothetical protein